MITTSNTPIAIAPNSITHLSDNFSLQEAITSDTAERNGIDNYPDYSTLQVMYKTAVKMEKVRALLSNPIHINSWFRCLELNRAIGSIDTSQHRKGEAVDFISPKFGTPLQICKVLIANVELINYDQLVLEHSWVHISFSILNSKPRNQVLSLLANKKYSSGLTDKQGKPL